MYVCGITPYDTTHLGHAFTYIFFDTLLRYLRYQEYLVTYTQNVTDINDRDNDLLKRAQEQNISWSKLAEYWTNHFLRDMQALNWVMPDNYLFASKHIPQMLHIIDKLKQNGLAYEVHGGMYLDIMKDKDFGKLSRLTQEQMVKRAKEFEEDVDNPDKHHPLDITLWRPTQTGQPMHIPSFPSAYGKGRPGWHIECSAMAISSLGEQIDIHGGGIDLIYPHHESEIAQSEGATGKKPFAKYWIHTGTVMYHGEKMSKSLGNLVLVSDLLKKYPAEVIRLVLLSHHYRSPWDFVESELDVAQSYLQVLQKALQKESTIPRTKDVIASDPELVEGERSNPLQDQKSGATKHREAFDAAMLNDMNIPEAIKVIVSLAEKIAEKPKRKDQQDLKKMMEILGLLS